MLIKKTVSLLLCAVMTLCLITYSVPRAYAAELDPTSIKAPSALLMDADSGTVLFDKNSHDIRCCASITKVMTLLLVMEALDSGKIKLDDIVTSSAHAASMGGSDIWLEEGETMSVDDMIKATAVASANDAAVALAEYICGTEDSFVAEMNNRAKELGMKDTVFKNCNGLDEEGHVTSAYDVALMSRELIKHKKVLEYTNIWMDELRDGKTQIVNTNKLLKSYNGITGLKTGTTSQAGACISATAERDGLSLIAVVLGCDTGKDRFSDATSILDYGFANFTSFKPQTPDDLLPELAVTSGMQNTVKTDCKITESYICPKGEAESNTYKIAYNDDISAPINKGDVLGKVMYYSGDKKLGEFDITAAEDVEEMTFGSVFSLLINCLFTH